MNELNFLLLSAQPFIIVVVVVVVVVAVVADKKISCRRLFQYFAFVEGEIVFLDKTIEIVVYT